MRPWLTGRHIACSLIALLIVGCAGPLPASRPQAGGPEALAQLREQQQDLVTRVQQLQDGMAQLEARLRDQQQQLDGLRKAAETGKGTVAGQITTPAAATAPGQPAPANGAPPAPTPPSPAAVYLQAFADYAAGRYDQAIEGFRLFLREFADNAYAGNARYWLGECYFARNDFREAAAAFQKVVDSYPQSAKAPDALLRRAAALQASGDALQADATLRLLRARYPASSAARKSVQSP